MSSHVSVATPSDKASTTRAESSAVAEDERFYPVRTAIKKEIGIDATPSTAWRWTKKGVAGGVKLKTAIVGARPMTKRVWVRQFVAATTAQRETATT